MTKRVAVIGSGPCGLSQLRAFQQAEAAGAEIPEVVCFEKQDSWGGLWNYTWRTGTDQYGEPVHGSMYRYLWSNGPKECLEFADYTFDEHFGKPIPSFPPREVLYDYITGRAKAGGLERFCRFSTLVKNVHHDDASDSFDVTYKDLKSDELHTERFDNVIVATGHFSVPNIPHFDGVSQFPGRVMHSHDFRDAREFSDRDVLVIGGSYSAEDVALQCHKYGARSVTISFRTAAMGFKWPATMEERPLLQRLEGRTAHFLDGSSKDVDAIIMSTGYLHHFPFLEDALRLKTHNRMNVPALYKGVCWEANPKLMYLGMQDQFYTFSMFDVQAWWARDVVMGRISLPDAAGMARDIDAWMQREGALEDAFQMIDFQTDYMKDLMPHIDYPSFDIDQKAEMFKVWEHHKEEDITTYRDNAFKSACTGSQSPLHHTPWLEAMDDSLETYLAVK